MVIRSCCWPSKGNVVSTRVMLLGEPEINIKSVNSFPNIAMRLSIMLQPAWVTNRTTSLQMPGLSVPTAVITRC
ncbi:Uncharacterised protein [Vibrio cholerae]|nr:Uncharacterised protein [Vibrio cholerae]